MRVSPVPGGLDRPAKGGMEHARLAQTALPACFFVPFHDQAHAADRPLRRISVLSTVCGLVPICGLIWKRNAGLNKTGSALFCYLLEFQ